ncbi:uncharacterized protein HMPREF1541_09495 [Cyphellophora europaea CBS 101466]|uniref:Uncharacterized protein n=1 Tax=Cyphellophora europaea (strain CBS 101466) TaxID=1220924 RepID=W2SAD6_CYPE1|nr:uncharacterized protein HMPREF1541_09495 [Cyphellophora europaea CBS 101466]ETN45662.1 hypothetical protein HMPREF1541_09495 [Cyphellophora europaea CBS 101466]
MPTSSSASVGASATSNLRSATTTHLRKTFKYPADEDDTSMDADRDELDEEEQDTLITDLASSNATTNEFYVRTFTVLPLLACLPFLYFLVLRPHRLTVLPCLLALTSLGASAFVMGFVPLEGVDFGSDSAGAGGGEGRGGLSDIAHAQASRRRAAVASRGGQLGVELPFSVPVDVGGPVVRWMGVLNGGAPAILVVFAVLLMDADGVGQGFWLLLLLPALMAAVVAVVRAAMREMERGLRELGGLRYGYKGA